VHSLNEGSDLTKKNKQNKPPKNQTQTTEKQSSDLSPALCQHRSETRAKPTWFFRVSCYWRYLLCLQSIGIPWGQSEKSTLQCLSGGKPSSPGAAQRREKGLGSSQMPARIKRHLLGWKKQARQSCRGKKKDTLKRINMQGMQQIWTQVLNPLLQEETRKYIHLVLNGAN